MVKDLNIIISNIDKYNAKIIVNSKNNESFEIKEQKKSIILKILNISSPALNKINHVPFYFFPPEKIKVSSSDNFQFNEIINNILYYLPSPQFPLKIELNFDPDKHKNVSIITFDDKFTKFLDPQNNKIIEFNNYLSNYSIIENNGNKISIILENILASPYKYIDDQELNIDKYLCFSDILIRCNYQKDLENIYKNKELYKDKIEEVTIDNTLYYSSNLNPLKFKELKLEHDYNIINEYKNIYSMVFNKNYINNLLNSNDENSDDESSNDESSDEIYHNKKYNIVKEFEYYLEFDLILRNPFSLNIFRMCLIRLQNNINEYFDNEELTFALNFIKKLINDIEIYIKNYKPF